MKLIYDLRFLFYGIALGIINSTVGDAFNLSDYFTFGVMLPLELVAVFFLDNKFVKKGDVVDEN